MWFIVKISDFYFPVGIKGIVVDENGNLLAGAHITIAGRESVPFKSLSNGAFFRLLMPGTYTVIVSWTLAKIFAFPPLTYLYAMVLYYQYQSCQKQKLNQQTKTIPVLFCMTWKLIMPSIVHIKLTWSDKLFLQQNWLTKNNNT